MTATVSPERAARRPAPLSPPDRVRALAAGRQTMRWLAIVLPWVLAGYALFDKGFAYVIRIPGTPIFAGEIVMLLVVAMACVATPYLHRGLERSTVAKLLLAFAAWGVVRTVPYFGQYHFDAVRDAALWYYSLLAIAVCALVLADPDLVPRWAGWYRRLIPWILALGPVSLLLGRVPSRWPIVPGSAISFWDHKQGNIAVQVSIALAFLWLVPGTSRRSRALLTGFATVLLLMVATQNRGGFVAALVGLAVLWLLAARRGRGRLVLAMLATVVLLFAVGWGMNIHVKGAQNREVSVGQLVQNVQSLTGQGSDANGNLSSNVEFRDQLWSGVLKKVKTEKKVLTGLGDGTNIAAALGFQGQQVDQLRSPHNSHLDVFARLGLIGAALWVAIWGAWFSIALRARSRLRMRGYALEAGLVGVSIVGVTATLVNAYFDPTIESPQVALWLWTLVGLTMGLAAISRRTTSPA
jgi:hypothetical protein